MRATLIVLGTTVGGGLVGGLVGCWAAFVYSSWELDSLPGAIGLMVGGLVLGGVAGAVVGAQLV